MATLRHLSDGSLRPLTARLLVGRAPSCGLHLDDPTVSGEHATVRWTGHQWEIRDLGSRNGTFVDSRRLAPGEAHVLASGARLGFGDPEAAWEIVDLGPPGAQALDLASGTVHLARDGLLALPSPARPDLLVYADGRGRWVVQRGEEEPAPIADSEVITVAGTSYRLQVPAAVAGTETVQVRPRLDTIQVRFEVSRDEEYVDLVVLDRGTELRLEHREHWYILLSLARARLEDAAEPVAEQGWLERERLQRMHRIDSNALNVAIYRARGQLAAAGIEGAAGVVEVRRGQRRIGLEPDRLLIGPRT